jgi:hypothetical protein
MREFRFHMHMETTGGHAELFILHDPTGRVYIRLPADLENDLL